MRQPSAIKVPFSNSKHLGLALETTKGRTMNYAAFVDFESIPILVLFGILEKSALGVLIVIAFRQDA